MQLQQRTKASIEGFNKELLQYARVHYDDVDNMTMEDDKSTSRSANRLDAYEELEKMRLMTRALLRERDEMIERLRGQLNVRDGETNHRERNLERMNQLQGNVKDLKETIRERDTCIEDLRAQLSLEHIHARDERRQAQSSKQKALDDGKILCFVIMESMSIELHKHTDLSRDFAIER